MKKIYFLLIGLCFFNFVSAQVINIPDSAFKTRLLEAKPWNDVAMDIYHNYIDIDTNNDKQIQINEAIKVKILRIAGEGIKSMVGIEYFTNIEFLDCNSNHLTALDISTLSNLKDLSCSGNQLNVLTLGNLQNLINVKCSNNQLTKLDLTGLPNLQTLFCDYNQLTSLNVVELPNFYNLQCDNNQLTNLNIEGLPELYLLSCKKNKISTLKITGLTNLEYLYCNENQISDLDFKGLFNLKEIECYENQLLKLDVSHNLNLNNLKCYDNKLSSLNTNNCGKMINLLCFNNQLSYFNFTGCISIQNIECYQNQLTSINFSSCTNIQNINCNNNLLIDLNVLGLKELKYLKCTSNLLTSLSIEGLDNLTFFDCSYNKLKILNISGVNNIGYLNCNDNLLTDLDLIGLNNPYFLNLQCQNNLLTTLNISSNTISSVNCENNKLSSIFMKNGYKDFNISFGGNPDLQFICADEDEINQTQYVLGLYKNVSCVINSYCSFTPGGTFYTIQGNQKYDGNQNGCDSSDEKFPNLNFSITNGIIKGNIISNAIGNYSIPVQAGTHTITPILENPNYFNVSPPSMSVTFPTQASPFIQNFCIAPNGIHNDLEVTILPIDPARPGFDATYKIIYKNKGTTTQSGSVSLSFNDAVLDYVSSIPATNNQAADKLTWDYTSLKPLESREITVTLNVNSPMETPAVNNGDRLSFNALINPIAGDEKPVDNSSALRQTVVGSYDPNDKTCLEGDVITPDLIGEYVHYLIRFENTGTYPAQNVVIKDLIDLSKFDISTLIPTKASHDFVTKISDNNKVEFIFENIQLPFADATNDGFVAFKIKTLPTLVVGDSFTNEANIYFDYNFPILTNTAKSTFQTLGTQDFQFADYFSLYPNPVKVILNIETKSTIEVKSMAVYDILGQIIIAVPDAKTVSNIDVSKLASGNYFLKMNTNKGTSNMKFIKK